MRRKSIDEQLIESERKDRLEHVQERVELLVSTIRGVIRSLDDEHPASVKLKEAISLIIEK